MEKDEILKYEVFPVEGGARPHFREGQRTDDVADQIAVVYNQTAEYGGRIVAAHNLTCDLDIGSKKPGDASKVVRVDYLFLVSEYPDDVTTPHEHDD